jgi:hypothetical protein
VGSPILSQNLLVGLPSHLGIGISRPPVSKRSTQLTVLQTAVAIPRVLQYDPLALCPPLFFYDEFGYDIIS